MQELAEVFGAPVVMKSAIREGSLRDAAQRIGKPVLLFEGGEGLRFDEITIRAGVAGVLRVLNHHGMISRRGVTKPKAPPKFCPSSKWVRAPMGGLLRIFKADGSLVRKGELLAAVSDPFGEREMEIIAPFSGIIVGRAVMPIVNEGDAIFHIGHVDSMTDAEGTVEHIETQLGDDPMFDEDEII